ncbi:PREDICTED: mitotic spindle assembly checkpoint protein MAD2B [Nicrophorus vespilloides]|uniref:Mitotic spindle assembly checkpoint protein MAD2B n=1 Tax=Nicrophorus vespilloides TaxID=110193 RepID=A0ABM1NGR5_NICVS|nr:PREDICTED: mitotic spindle assembly checkpoint protein MAD2B [Nicrophorus vespilloides]
MATKSYNSVVVDILCEFLEISVHNILYVRKIYPESIFVPKRKYGVVIHKSQHPLLNDYIAECMKAVHFHANANQLKRLFICIKTASKQLEKFVFDIVKLKSIIESDLLYVKLEQDFRAFSLKLGTSHIYLNPLPADVEFSIQIHTTEYSAIAYNDKPLCDDFPWISLPKFGTELKEIIPVHTVDCDHLLVQIYIEKET